MKYYLFRKYTTFILPYKTSIVGKFNMAVLVRD